MKDESKNNLRIGGGKILLLLFFALISGSVWGETYSFLLEKTTWSALGVQMVNGINWTLTGTSSSQSPYFGYDSSKGQQLGSGSNPFTQVGLSTEDIVENITEIKVSTSGASQIKATLQVKVGGVLYLLSDGTTEQTLTNSTTEYTFTGASSGKVELIWNNSSAKALYLKSVSITYEQGGEKVLPVVFSHEDGMASDKSFVLTASCPTEGATIYYTQSNEGEPDVPTSASAVFPEGGLEINKTTTVKAIAIAEGMVDSKVTTATYRIGKTPEIGWGTISFTVDITDKEVSFPVLSTNSDGVLSYTSSNTLVATVSNDGSVVIQGVGTTTITASVAATDTYLPAQAEYTLVIVRNGQSDLSALVALAKDGNYYAMATSSETGTERFDALRVNVLRGRVIKENWTNDIAWDVNEDAGTIMSVDGKYLSHKSSTSIVLSSTKYTWNWNSDEQYWYCTTTGNQSRFLGCSGTSYFRAFASKTEEYKGAVAMPFTDGYVREVAGASVEAPRYGTICLPCDVAAEDFSGAEFYSVLGKVMTGDEVTAIALSEPLTELKAGTPYIFSATDEKLLIAYTGEAVEEAKTANGLVGSLSDRLDVPEGKHLLTNNTVQICGTGCYIASNRAYVDFDQMEVYVPMAGVNMRLISFEGVTAVRERQIQAETKVDVYSVDGVCIRRQVDMPEAVSGLSKGLYIVNGKKMTVN